MSKEGDKERESKITKNKSVFEHEVSKYENIEFWLTIGIYV